MQNKDCVESLIYAIYVKNNREDVNIGLLSLTNRHICSSNLDGFTTFFKFIETLLYMKDNYIYVEIEDSYSLFFVLIKAP